MAYRLTKRTGAENTRKFAVFDFQSLKECLVAASRDTNDFLIERGHRVVDYRIEGVQKD